MASFHARTPVDRRFAALLIVGACTSRTDMSASPSVDPTAVPTAT